MRRSKSPQRKPHPDPGIELQLQRIIAQQAAISRQKLLIREYMEQLEAARDEQDDAGHNLRSSGPGDNYRKQYEIQMAAQRERITAAESGIVTAEAAISARHEEIAAMAAKLSDSDLAWL